MWFQHSGLNHTETENFSQRGKVGNQTFLLYAPPSSLKLSQCSRQRGLRHCRVLSAFVLPSLAVGMGALH